MTKPYTLHLGDCIEVMRSLPDNSVDSIVCDPPYGIDFMGKDWDSFGRTRDYTERGGYGDKGLLPGYGRGGTSEQREKYRRTSNQNFQEWCEAWAREALRVLKPGGHLLAFSGSRTYHRMTVAIEDAGFEIRDQIMWVYGSGFPKSLNVAKAIESGGGRPEDIRRMQQGDDYEPSGRGRVNYDHGAASAMGAAAADWQPTTDAARQWSGWGTALKPAHEPICVARKHLQGTVAANVLQFGTGALNIDGCRVEPTGESRERIGEASQERRYTDAGGTDFAAKQGVRGGDPAGRWPANLLLSWPEDEYELRQGASEEQRAEIQRWLDANA